MSELISLSNVEEWQSALDCVEIFDIYHTAAYHGLVSLSGYEPYLLKVSDGNFHAVFPFVVRNLAELPWYSGCKRDAISVYGYPGPLCSRNARSSADFHRYFLSELVESLDKLDVIALFARSNPVLSPAGMFGRYSEAAGLTVSIDLKEDISAQVMKSRKSHRYETRKSRNAGVRVHHDLEFDDIGTFIEIYEARMSAIGASDGYFFNGEYYQGLTELPEFPSRLLHATLNDKIIASAFFLISGQGIQYHLSATKHGFDRFSPTRLIIEDMREWGVRNGKEWLHLGGGVGAQEDSLYRFKAGFGQGRAEFSTASIVINEREYKRVCEMRDASLSSSEFASLARNFFPSYRESVR